MNRENTADVSRVWILSNLGIYGIVFVHEAKPASWMRLSLNR